MASGILKWLSGIIMMSVVLLCGCQNEKITFLRSDENIESVQIIQVNEYDEETQEFDVTVLCDIYDTHKFMNALQNIKAQPCYSVGIYYFKENVTAVQINYNNGEWEWLSYDSQARYSLKSGANYYKRMTLDAEQFDALIVEYMSQRIP